LFFECLNLEEGDKTVMRNVGNFLPHNSSFTFRKTRTLSNISLRTGKKKLDAGIKRNRMYLAKVNVGVGITVATLETGNVL
jgi:hypothetical protein